MIIIIFKKYSRPAVTSTHCFVQVNIVLYHIVYRFLTVMRLLFVNFSALFHILIFCQPFWAKVFFILFYFLFPLKTQKLLNFYCIKHHCLAKCTMCMFNCTGCYSLKFKRFFSFFCIFHGLNSNVNMLMQKYLSQMLGICINVNL